MSLDARPKIVAEITRESAHDLGLRPGLRVYASFKSSGVTAYT